MSTQKDRPVKVDADTYELLRRLSEREQRTQKAIVDRALKMYAARDKGGEDA